MSKQENSPVLYTDSSTGKVTKLVSMNRRKDCLLVQWLGNAPIYTKPTETTFKNIEALSAFCRKIQYDEMVGPFQSKTATCLLNEGNGQCTMHDGMKIKRLRDVVGKSRFIQSQSPLEVVWPEPMDYDAQALELRAMIKPGEFTEFNSIAAFAVFCKIVGIHFLGRSPYLNLKRFGKYERKDLFSVRYIKVFKTSHTGPILPETLAEGRKKHRQSYAAFAAVNGGTRV